VCACVERESTRCAMQRRFHQSVRVCACALRCEGGFDIHAPLNRQPSVVHDRGAVDLTAAALLAQLGT